MRLKYTINNSLSIIQIIIWRACRRRRHLAPPMGELAAPKGQTERVVRFATVLLRYPLSQPDGCQLSQRESQGR